MFDSIRINDPEIRQWFVDVIRARARSGQDQNKAHRQDLERQRDQVEAKLKALLDLRMEGEINAGEYAEKRRELHERQSAIALQLDASRIDDREIADLAVKAFELSQSLRQRWLTADYAAKRTILEIMCSELSSNSEHIQISLRKPFDLLRDEKFVPLSGATGNRTPIC